MNKGNDISTLFEKLTEIVKDAALIDKANEVLSEVLASTTKPSASYGADKKSVVAEAARYAFGNVEEVDLMPDDGDDTEVYAVGLGEGENDLYGPAFEKLSAYLLLRNIHLSKWHVHVSAKMHKIGILLMIDKENLEKPVTKESQKDLDLEIYPENELLLNLSSYLINKKVGCIADHPAMRKSEYYTELTPELAKHIVEMIDASKDIDIEYVSMPFKDYKEWGDAEKDELKKHIGEVVEITRYGSSWPTVMEDKIFPDGAELTLTNELFATAGKFLIEDCSKWISDCNMLKWALSLAKANNIDKKAIFELFKEGLSFGEKKYKEDRDKRYAEYLKSEEEKAENYQQESYDVDQPPF